MKGKLQQTVVRSGLFYGLQKIVLTKRQKVEMEGGGQGWIRFKNEQTRGTAGATCVGEKVREATLR